MSFVTSQIARGSFGCSTRPLLPTCRGFGSSRRMLLMEGVHSYQRSTSLRTFHTSSTDASIFPRASVTLSAINRPLKHVDVPRLRFERLFLSRPLLLPVESG